VVDGVAATDLALFVEGVCVAGFFAGVLFAREAVLAGLLCGGSFFGAVVLVVVDESVLLSLGGAAAAGFLAARGLGAAFVEGVCFAEGFDCVVVAGLTGFAADDGADVVGFFVGVGLLPGVVELCTLAGPIAAGFFADAAF